MTDPYNTAPAVSGIQLTDAMITTSPDLPGFRIVQSMGIVRGLIVRSRSIVGNFLGGLQTLFGGDITIYTSLCEKARADAFRQMTMHARQRKANAIVTMRYDATELMPGLTEVLCYGTAVVVEIEAR
ncbi:MAG: YbjQ family protein [Dokdonella sp.]